MTRLITTLSILSLACAAGVAACIIPDREIQVVVKNPCGEEWAAQTPGAYGYDGSSAKIYITTDNDAWISEHYCLNHADGVEAADIYSDLAADMLSHVVLTCQERAANLGLVDIDNTCISTADVVYIGKCQHPKGGCEDPPSETGDETAGETGGTDGTTGGFAEFGSLDLHAEIRFSRGEYLISDRLIAAAIDDPMGLAFDGTSLELSVDALGDARGFRVSGISRDNLGGLLGLRDGDVVFEIGGQPTLSFEQLIDAAAQALERDSVGVLIERDGSIVSLRYRRW